MSRIDELPADRRAVLQLLLKQGRSYDDLAGLLRIEPDAVRERARDALDRLGPTSTDLDPDEQDEIADYLLGQQTASQRASTRNLLETSAASRAWARVVAGELRASGMAAEGLPEIPAERAEVDEAFDALQARKVARERQARSSRLGGVLLLAAVGVAIAFLVVFVISGNDDSGDSASTGAATATTTKTTTSGRQILGQVNLNPVRGSPRRKALAAVTLVAQGGATGIIFQGQSIPANRRGDVYALWLVSNRSAARLGFTPRVGKSGRLRFTGQLPAGVKLGDFSAMALTRETSANPRTPGKVIVAGALPGQG